MELFGDVELTSSHGEAADARSAVRNSDSYGKDATPPRHTSRAHGNRSSVNNARLEGAMISAKSVRLNVGLLDLSNFVQAIGVSS